MYLSVQCLFVLNECTLMGVYVRACVFVCECVCARARKRAMMLDRTKSIGYIQVFTNIIDTLKLVS